MEPERKHGGLSTTQGTKPTGPPDTEDHSPTGDHGQPDNPPAEKGAAILESEEHPVRMPGLLETLTVDSKYAGGDHEGSGKTEPHSGKADQTTHRTLPVQGTEQTIFHHKEESHDSTAMSSTAHLTTADKVRGAAELKEGNSNGISYVAVEEGNVQGVSKEQQPSPSSLPEQEQSRQQCNDKAEADQEGNGAEDRRNSVKSSNLKLKDVKLETTTPVLSAPDRTEVTTQHPLSEQMNETESKGAAKVLKC